MGKAIARKALALSKLGKLEESLQAYDEALLENNHYDIKEARKKVEKAKKEAETLAYINPEIAEQHKARGNELFTGGDFVNALKEFNAATRGGNCANRHKEREEKRRLLGPFAATVPTTVHTLLHKDLAGTLHVNAPSTV